MTLKEYKKRLKKHDWYYRMSDDVRVYDRGQAEEVKLKELAKGNKSFEKEFNNHSKITNHETKS